MAQQTRTATTHSARSSGSGDELVYLPLGGAGEIGMNLYLYGFGPSDARQWLMVDLGITFPEEGQPGVDIILPDIRFIEEEAKGLQGIVLTHAHEDHFGAVIELWPRLKAPVYATPFTAALLKAKMAEQGVRVPIPIREVPLKGRVKIGPFDVEFVTVAHSIPEPNALAIRTPLGLVFHSGDWKLDPDPVAGAATDLERIKQIADQGIMAFVCDSTNAMRDGFSPSEAAVTKSITEIIRGAKRAVAVTTFASNVARLKAVADAASAAGRHLVVAGRSMHRVIEVARETGYLPRNFKYYDQNEYGYLEPSEVVCLCTGSQGEPRAAMARIAEDQHPAIALKRGDLVIFSSRTIPGNETAIGRIQNQLAGLGCEIITDANALVHVTGHPRRGELKQMYALTKPGLAVPMHGELRHMEEHARLAREAGIKDVRTVHNGQILRLAPGAPKIIDEAPTGRLYRDGRLIISAEDVPVRQRRKLAVVGLVAVAIVVDKKGELLADPEIELDGIPERDAAGRAMLELVADAVEGTIESIPRPRRRDLNTISEAVRRSVRARVDEAWGKKPICKVLLTQV